MKKILYIIAILVVGFGGFVFYLQDYVKSKYDEYTLNLQNISFNNGLSIDLKQKSYKKGLFDARGVIGGYVKIANEVVEVEVISDIKYGLNVLSGAIDINNAVKILTDKESVVRIFGTDTPLSINSKIYADESADVVAKLVAINYHNHNSIKSDPITIFVNAKKDGFKSYELDMPSFSLKNDGNELSLQGLKFDSKLDDYIKFKDYILYKMPIEKENSSFVIDKFIVKSQGEESIDLQINDMTAWGESRYKGEKVDMDIGYKIANIKLDSQDIIKNLDVELSAEGFNFVAYVKHFNIFDNMTNTLDISDEMLLKSQQAVLELLSGAKINLKKLSLANPKDRVVDFKFNLKFPDINTKDFESIMALYYGVDFDGELKTKGSFTEFIRDYNLPDTSTVFVVAMLEEQLKLKNGENSLLKFKYDKNNMDIIINDDIKLSSLMGSGF
ncbi:DUF945 family protein [Campylobacter sp. faydin G-140]|uniref:DUF945 family protein n=1 Tax=Campylobacter anatolicus TaxID=2829105 RepID=UPI001BA15A8C|nr:DUF945 family protein [Campylobacter anatolicus]